MSNQPISNEVYDVVSVLYHLLQGSETIDKYCHDSESVNDEELKKFFEEVQEANNHLAGKAQKLLKDRCQ